MPAPRGALGRSPAHPGSPAAPRSPPRREDLHERRSTRSNGASSERVAAKVGGNPATAPSAPRGADRAHSATRPLPLQGHCRAVARTVRTVAPPRPGQPHPPDQNAGRIAAQVPPELSTGSTKPPRQRGRCALSTGPPHRAASGAAGAPPRVVPWSPGEFHRLRAANYGASSAEGPTTATNGSGGKGSGP
jgi:hypothetical protein